MAYYDVNKTDGTRVALVAERQLFPVGGIDLLGKNYSSYGEVMAENMVKMIEHFSSTQAPTNPLTGQLWYDAQNNILKLLKQNTWTPVQLDLGTSTVTGFDYTRIQDSASTELSHPAIKIKVDGVVIAVVSAASTSYVPAQSSGLTSSFPTISPGINFNSDTSTIYKLHGRSIESDFKNISEIYVADSALSSGDIVSLGGSAEIRKTSGSDDDQIFGVISSTPGLLLNAADKMTDFAYPVAIKGRVLCKVKGAVTKGQRIVASDEQGVGVAVDTLNPAITVGRAIESRSTTATGLIEIVVGVY